MDISWATRVKEFFRFPIFRKLIGAVIFFVAYSCAEIYLKIRVLGGDAQFPIGLHTLFGVTLSILLVFRINTTYDRWWEARKWWTALTNTSRNVAQVVAATAVPMEEKRRFAELQRDFAFSLRDHIRLPHTPVVHGPLALSAEMVAANQRWLDQHFLVPQQWSALDSRLAGYQEVCGACERIRRTPLPLTHRATIPQVLAIYLLVLPWGLPVSWVTPLIVGIVSYFVLALELIAGQLEDPFGDDPDDLPLTAYANNIANGLQQLYGPLLPSAELQLTGRKLISNDE